MHSLCLNRLFTLQLCLHIQLPVDKVIPTCVAKENFLVSESQKHWMIQGQQGIYWIYHGLHMVDCSAYHAVMKVQQSKTKKKNRLPWRQSDMLLTHTVPLMLKGKLRMLFFFFLFFPPFLFFPILVQWDQEKSLARTLKHHFGNK